MNVTTVSKGPNNKARGNVYAEESGVEGVSSSVSVAKSRRAVERRPQVKQGSHALSEMWTSGPVPAVWASCPFYRGSTSPQNLDIFEFAFVSYRSKEITVRLSSSLHLVKRQKGFMSDTGIWSGASVTDGRGVVGGE